MARWPEDSTRRIWHALVLVFLRATLLFVVGIGIVGTMVVGGDPFSGGWKTLMLVVPLLGGLDFGLILNVGLLRVGKVSLKELGWKFDHVATDIVLGLIGFALCTAVLLGALVGSGEMTLGELMVGLVARRLPEELTFLCIAVFGAALVEETLFRGYLQPALALKFGLVQSILLQAVIFSAMHMRFHPIGFLVKVAFGCIFGALRWKDRSLLAPGIAHGLIWAVWGA